jgi:hypothetical protein
MIGLVPEGARLNHARLDGGEAHSRLQQTRNGNTGSGEVVLPKCRVNTAIVLLGMTEIALWVFSNLIVSRHRRRHSARFVDA